jgi:hypothetical protein
MALNPLDEQTAHRLLAGALAPEDAPPGYGTVAALLQVARGPATAEEVARRTAVVSAMAAAIGNGSPALATFAPKEKHVLGKFLSLKALGIAVPVMALTATAAAAATGGLPGPAQSALHGALAHVGLSVPAPGDASKAKGPDATGPAKHGLCTAYAANGGHASSHSVAFTNLQNAAGAAGLSVADYCKGVTPGHPASTGSGSTGSAGSTSHAKGPDATGPAKHGLCTAYAANGGQASSHSVAFTNLQNAAAAAGLSVSDYCKGVTPGHRASTGSGSTGSGSSHGGNDNGAPPNPKGPPPSTPGSQHGTPSNPKGPSPSTPGSQHGKVETPAGPPTSTPGGKR